MRPRARLPRRGQGRRQAARPAAGLLFQLAGLFPGRLRAGRGLVLCCVCGVGGFPGRCRGLGGLGGLRRRGGRVRFGAAAGGLGLGQHRGDPPGSAAATCADAAVASRDASVSSCASLPSEPAARPPRRRRDGRLAAHRVVVPDAALVAAELPRPAPLAGRQRPAASRALAPPAAITCRNAPALGHHVSPWS